MDGNSYNKLQEQLLQLSYRDGEGVVAQSKRRMDPNLRVLLVGFGGTGLDALERTVAELKMALPADVFSKQIGILAVDTARDALKCSGGDSEEKKEVDDKPDRFNRVNEWFLLPYLDADNWKQNPELVPDEMNEWLNPGVLQSVTFTGDGAGKVRQAGRILLTQPSAAPLLVEKIRSKVRELYRESGTQTRLVVFQFYGLAGGTGSGCVIDGSYLIRHAVEAESVKANFCGYLFLPAVADTESSTLHRNAYAALKEVDYHMNIERRQEQFTLSYTRDLVVTSNKNIFDVCAVLEGKSNGVVSTYDQNRKNAMSATANTILDNITALPIKAGIGAAVHSVDEYVANLNQDYKNMLGDTPHEAAPRAANYSFAILGHARALVPINLLKAHVMHRVFKMAMERFEKYKNVKEEDVKEFLKECKIVGWFKDSFSDSRKKVDKYLKDCFTNQNKGPSYVVNLLYEAAKELEDKTSLSKDQEKMLSYIRFQNNNVFTVYSSVITQIAEYLNDGNGILTSVSHRKEIDHVSFNWILGEFDTKFAENVEFVNDYLKDLVNDQQVRTLVGQFLREMVDHVHEWTELNAKDANQQPRFCAVKRLRKFIADHIDKIVNCSVEEYLIKYYSGKSGITAFSPDGQLTHDGEKALATAASEIIKDMFTDKSKARPLANITTTGMISLEKFPSKAFLYVPEGAPNLFLEISRQLQGNPTLERHVKLYRGTSSDSITGYWRYDCVPAHQLEWTVTGEKCYENAIMDGSNSVGMHLSETTGGKQWKNLPNLCSREIWRYMEPNYSQKREGDLADKALEVMKRAEKYGLTDKRINHSINAEVCDLFMLEQDSIPDAALIQALDVQTPGLSAYDNAEIELKAVVDRKAQALFDKLQLGANQLLITPISNECRTDIQRQLLHKTLAGKNVRIDCVEVGGPLDIRSFDRIRTPPQDWVIDLASKLLRVRIDMMFRLRGNVLVMERLAEMVEAHNCVVRAKRKAAEEIEGFAKLCSQELLEYRKYDGINKNGKEDTLYQWLYNDENNDEHELADLNPTSPLEMTAKHFFAFKAYLQLNDKEKEHLAKTLASRIDTNRAREDAEKKFNALVDVLKRLRTAKKLPVEITDAESEDANVQRFLRDAKFALASSQFPAQIKDESLAAEIRKFYDDFMNVVPTF